MSDGGGEVMQGSFTSGMPALQLLPSRKVGDTSAGLKNKSIAELPDSIKKRKA